MTNFRALVLHEEGGKVVPRLENLDEERLPAGEVTVRVEYSTLNYKDGMVLQGEGRLVRQYPHVPGIDFVGTVPPELQPPTLFVGALPKNSEHPEAAIALLQFLSSADAAAVITKAGLKPLGPR